MVGFTCSPVTLDWIDDILLEDNAALQGIPAVFFVVIVRNDSCHWFSAFGDDQGLVSCCNLVQQRQALCFELFGRYGFHLVSSENMVTNHSENIATKRSESFGCLLTSGFWLLPSRFCPLPFALSRS